MTLINDITSILDPSGLLQTSIDAAKDELEYRWRECESVYHASGEFDHSGPAAYLQIGPCEHVTGLRCAANVARARHIRSCPFCHINHPITEFTFIPLGDI